MSICRRRRAKCYPSTMSFSPWAVVSQIVLAIGACACAGPAVSPPPAPSSASRPRPSASQATSCRYTGRPWGVNPTTVVAPETVSALLRFRSWTYACDVGEGTGWGTLDGNAVTRCLVCCAIGGGGKFGATSWTWLTEIGTPTPAALSRATRSLSARLSIRAAALPSIPSVPYPCP